MWRRSELRELSQADDGLEQLSLPDLCKCLTLHRNRGQRLENARSQCGGPLALVQEGLAHGLNAVQLNDVPSVGSELAQLTQSLDGLDLRPLRLAIY